MIKLVLLAIAALALGLSGARADFAFTLGSGATAFSFTAATGGTSLCAASVTHCFASVPINTAGTQIFTAAAPGSVTGSGAAGTAATGVVTVQGIASMTKILVTPDLPTGAATSANQTTWQSATGAAVPANAIYNGVNVGGNIVGMVGDPCQTNAKNYQTISQTANTQLFAGTSTKKTYVCHIIVVGSDAENVSLVSGTGSVCATSTAAVIGSTTAAAGPNLSANGGFSIGNGGYAIAVSAVNADNVCLFQSGSGRVAGVMSYVVQ